MRDMYFGPNSATSVPGREQAAAKSATLAEKPARLSILVVDDEPLIRWSLLKGLTRRGHEVVEADTGAAALEAIGNDPSRFGVVVLDYRLPDRQDLSLLADVRRRLPQAVVVMMTAFAAAEMRTEAMALGARAVIDKPFQVNQLIGLVELPTVN